MKWYPRSQHLLTLNIQDRCVMSWISSTILCRAGITSCNIKCWPSYLHCLPPYLHPPWWHSWHGSQSCWSPSCPCPSLGWSRWPQAWGHHWRCRRSLHCFPPSPPVWESLPWWWLGWWPRHRCCRNTVFRRRIPTFTWYCFSTGSSDTFPVSTVQEYFPKVYNKNIWTHKIFASK